MIGSIVLIDDHTIDRMQQRRILIRSRLVERIVEFAEPEAALAYLIDPATTRPDIVLLDINMPRMTGLELLQAATEARGDKFADAVIIMLTVDLLPDDRAFAESLPVVRGFVEKPLRVQDLAPIADLLATTATA